MQRIFMLSNHALFCEGIESLLASDGELAFVGREANVDQGIQRIHELRLDVVILVTVHQSVTRPWQRSCSNIC